MSILSCVKGKITNKLFLELEDEYKAILKNAGGDTALADANMLVSFENRVNTLKKAEVKAAIKTSEILTEVGEVYKYLQAEYDGMSARARKMADILQRKPSFKRAAEEFYNRAANSGQREVTDTMEKMAQIHDNIAAKGFRLGVDRKTFAEVFDGLIDGADSVGNSQIKGMVKEVRSVTDLLLKKYKAQGGMLGEVKNYTPIKHSRAAIAKVSYDEWSAAYREMNDISRMVDFKSGKVMTEKRFEEIMQHVYQDIITDGASRAQRALDKTGGRTKGYVPHDMFTRRMQQRLSVPKNAEAFKRYNQKFGVGDAGLYDLYLGSLREMAHDVGVMKELGPMPSNMALTLEAHAVANNATSSQLSRMKGMYRTLVGHWDGSSDSLITQSVSSMQSLLSSSMLGTASVSAMGDVLLHATARQMAGLAGHGKTGASAYLKALSGNPEDMVRGIHMMEAMAHTQVSRFLEGEVGTFSGAIPQGINSLKNLNHRMSGLHSITLAGGDAMSLSLASGMGEMVSKGLKFADVPADFQRVLMLNGLNEGDWKQLLKAGVDEKGFITRNGLPDGMDRIGEKIGNMEIQLRAWTTNSPELRTRMYSSGNAFGSQVRGGLGHLTASSVMQFKSFPLQVWRNHFTPAMIKAANAQVAPLITLLIGGMFMGGMIVQLKEMLKGNPILEWDDPALYGRGLVQSGVGGVLGDILFKDPEQYKRNILSELAGPVASFTGDTTLEALKLAKNAGAYMLGSDDADVDFKPMMRATRTAIPLSTLWYWKVGIDRLVMDGLNTMVDPEYYENIERREKRFQEERGQRSYYDQHVRQ